MSKLRNFIKTFAVNIKKRQECYNFIFSHLISDKIFSKTCPYWFLLIQGYLLPMAIALIDFCIILLKTIWDSYVKKIKSFFRTNREWNSQQKSLIYSLLLNFSSIFSSVLTERGCSKSTAGSVTKEIFNQATNH